MLYLHKEKCKCCELHRVGFRLCSDGITIACLCDECFAAWANPRDISEIEMQYPEEASGYTIKPSGLSVAIWKGSRWATLQEIHSAGYLEYVEGPPDLSVE